MKIINVKHKNYIMTPHNPDIIDDILILTDRIKYEDGGFKEINKLDILLENTNYFAIVEYDDNYINIHIGNLFHSFTMSRIKNIFNAMLCLINWNVIQHDLFNCDIKNYSNIIILHSSVVRCIKAYNDNDNDNEIFFSYFF